MGHLPFHSLMLVLLAPNLSNSADISNPIRQQIRPAEGTLREMRLPTGVNEIVAHSQAESGDLFLATEGHVFIRSPFGRANGWERIDEVRIGKDDRIVSLACCHLVSGESLLVTTESNVIALSWQHDDGSSQPWRRFRYSFHVDQIQKGEFWGPHRRIDTFSRESSSEANEHSVKAWVATSSCKMVPILNQAGGLEFGEAVDLDGGGVLPEWTAGTGGWSYAWPFASAALWTLDPDGDAIGKSFDFRDLMAPDPIVRDRVEIECVWLDEARDLLFVGTSHGLAVADVEDGTGRRTSEFLRVEQAGLATIKLIGSTAGRMWFVTGGSDDIEGDGGPLLMERTVGRRCGSAKECSRMSFFRPVEGGDWPNHVLQAVQVDDDRVLVDSDRIWFWNPGSWSPVPGADTSLAGVGMGDVSAPGRYPFVMSNPLEDGLWYLRPDSETGWYSRPSSRHKHTVMELVPDPSGSGVWSLSDGTSAATQFGWLTFQSAHGMLSGELNLSGGPRRIRVRSLSLQLADGERRWPVSQVGGLLLPSGENLVHAESGYQQAIEWPLSDGISLEHMLPGGESSNSAWLAIRIEPGQPQRVVRVDLSEDTVAGESARLEIVSTGVECDENGLATLLPDSEGNVWLAVGAATESLEIIQWTAHRVHSIVDESDKSRDLGRIPFGETPRLLWLAPDEGLLSKDHALFTERGVVVIPRNELPLNLAEPRLLVHEQRPTGEWARLFPNDDSRHVRSAIQTRILAPFEAPTAGTMLLTDSVPDDIIGIGPFAGTAFQFGIEQPARTLQVVAGVLRETKGSRPVVDWLPGEFGVPDFVVWDQEQGPDSRSIIELLVREDASTLNSWRLDIPLMENVTLAIRVPEDYDSNRPGIDLAVTNGSLIATHSRRDEHSWDRSWLPGLPTSITIHDSESGSQTYSSGDTTLPSTLPHTATELELQLAPSYTQWWVTDLSTSTLASDEDLTGVAFGPDGTARIPLQPGSDYEVSIKHRDPLSGEVWPLVNLPVATDATPPAPAPTNPFLYVVMTLAGLVVSAGSAIIVSTASRRLVAAWFRRSHWNVVVAACHLEAEIPLDDQSVRFRRPRDEDFDPELDSPMQSHWNLPAAVFGQRLPEICGDSPVATVLAEGESELLAMMSLRSLYRPNEETDAPVITGFVPTRFRVPGRPAPVRRLVIAEMQGQTAADRCGNNTSAIGRLVSERGFRHIAAARNEVPQQQFCSLLKSAHVVIVNGDLSDCGFRDARVFEDTVRGRDLQCRLLICVGGEATGDASKASGTNDSSCRDLLPGLAASGIHVVSVNGQTEATARSFIEQMLESLLPATGREGQSLAQSLLGALAATSELDPAAGRAAEESLVVFGDPSAKVAETPTYDAFLSHSHKDKAAVRWLHRFLRKRWLLWQRRRRLCIDEEDFSAFELSQEVPRRLSGSQHLIVCCSENGAGSHWVRREIKYFLRDHPAKRVLLCDTGPERAVDDVPAAFLAEIEHRSGLSDPFRPNLRGAPSKVADERNAIQAEAFALLASLMGTERSIFLRQRTVLWVCLIVLAVAAAVGGVAFAWWKQTVDGLLATTIAEVVHDAESGNEVNHPGLIPMGAAFGRMNNRSTLERFAKHLKQEDWRALYLANGYLAMPQPDCDAAKTQLETVDAISLGISPRPALRASIVCRQFEWLTAAEPDDPADRGVNWVEALIDTGQLDSAETALNSGEFYELDIIPLRLRLGVARGPDFRFPDGFLTQVENHNSVNSVLYEVLLHVRELDWQDRLSEPVASQLLDLCVRLFRNSQGERVLPHHWQQLAAHLLKVGQRDVALELLQFAPPEEPDLSHANTWAWRGLAMHRLDRADEATRCFTRSEACASMPAEMSRTFAEWFEIARVYALADDWKAAFRVVDKPGIDIARFQLKCFVIELRSGGPMNSQVLGTFQTN